MLEALEELESLFPEQVEGLLSEVDRETVHTVLASDTFHQQLPDLRSALRGLKDHVVERYRKERDAYDGDLKAVLEAVQAEPEWSRLLDEDHEEIAARLRRDFPNEPDEEHSLRSLQTLLVRRAALSGQIDNLRREVGRRAPAEPVSEPIIEENEEVVEVELDAATLFPATAIRNQQDLDAWLAALREQLSALLREKRYIRIRPVGSSRTAVVSDQWSVASDH